MRQKIPYEVIETLRSELMGEMIENLKSLTFKSNGGYDSISAFPEIDEIRIFFDDGKPTKVTVCADLHVTARKNILNESPAIK